MAHSFFYDTSTQIEDRSSSSLPGIHRHRIIYLCCYFTFLAYPYSYSQNLGWNVGYFMSFTVFTLLSSGDFCNRWIRSGRFAGKEGILTLNSYLWLCGMFFIISTAFLFCIFFIYLFSSSTSHLPLLHRRLLDL